MDHIVENDDSQSVLPPEIKSHIFAYLPLTDRKRARLTCRSWYDCSVHSNIVKREKYVFRIHSSVEEIAELMLRSNYSQLNLEFQGVPVKELPADAWKVCGERIQTLEFYKCQWNVETFRNVILYCTNLTSIVIKSIVPSCHNDADGPIGILCSSDVLDDLIKKGLRRSKLRTFAMLNKGVQLPESVLYKVILLFPGIKHFSTGSHLTIYPPTTVSFRLDQCFNPETRLESLTLNLPTDGSWMETFVQKAEQGIGLKKLDTILTYQRSMKDSLFDFFKSQRNLKDLKLRVARARAAENKELFFHILNNCPNLQAFFFETDTDRIDIEPSELPQFISSTSKLKFLRAIFNMKYGTPAPLYLDLLAKPAQSNLTSLRWYCHDVDFTNAFLQRCPSLLHLNFGGVGCHDSTLQIIFQFLVELRTLVLYATSLCTDYGFTGRSVDGREEGYSIKRLQQLKYLSLQAAGTRGMDESTLELQLPRLEHLSLNGIWFTKRRSRKALIHLASHLPELRVLKIEKFDIQWTAMRICLRFKNLQRLIISKNYPYINRDNDLPSAEIIFGSCPSLRYICVGGFGVFSRNPFTGKVLHSGDQRSFRFPGNVFEGGSSAII